VLIAESAGRVTPETLRQLQAPALTGRRRALVTCLGSATDASQAASNRFDRQPQWSLPFTLKADFRADAP